MLIARLCITLLAEKWTKKQSATSIIFFWWVPLNGGHVVELEVYARTRMLLLATYALEVYQEFEWGKLAKFWTLNFRPVNKKTCRMMSYHTVVWILYLIGRGSFRWKWMGVLCWWFDVQDLDLDEVGVCDWSYSVLCSQCKRRCTDIIVSSPECKLISQIIVQSLFISFLLYKKVCSDSKFWTCFWPARKQQSTHQNQNFLTWMKVHNS